MDSIQKRKNRVGKIIPVLERVYPHADCTLDYENPYQLLMATILAAQCTDVRVNMVTPTLFGEYPSPAALAAADGERLMEIIKSTGFFRNKTSSMLACARGIVQRFGGSVPDTLDDLVSLKGVGRKTANVVLGNAFGIPGMVVDTHVKRLSSRLGLTGSTNPVIIEQDLMEVVSKKQWTLFSHLLVFHGRTVCKARRPDCSCCLVSKWCPKKI